MQFSIAMWIMPLNVGSLQTIYTTRNDYNSNTFYLQINVDGSLCVHEDASNWWNVYGLLSIGKWTHIGLIPNDQGFDLYMNGVLNNRLQTSAHLNIYANLTRTNYNSTFGAKSAPLNAYLDDVMFFDRTITSTEMQAAMLAYN